MLRLLVCGVLLLTTVCQAQGAPKLDETRRDLKQLRQQIKSTNQQLLDKKQAARQLVKQLHAGNRKLRQARLDLTRARRQVTQLDERIQQQKEQLSRSRVQQRRLEKQVQKRLKVLYKGGGTQLVKVLFSAQSPAAMAEEYHFLQRMVRSDRELLDDYRQQLRQTNDEIKKLDRLQNQQKQVLAKRQQQKARLKQANRDSQQLLAKVRQDEGALAVLLQELEEKAARLSGLVNKLKRKPTTPSQGHGTRFRSQRGRLSWPVKGPVKIGFGTGRHPELGTRYDSHGIEIGVNGSKSIKAVWDGHVIFAKPFRGYGNLLIIDHGDSYYTLYAQASRLTRKAGDRVERGEEVAISGFEGADVVYFEIRKGGTPLDPLRWLSRRRR